MTNPRIAAMDQRAALLFHRAGMADVAQYRAALAAPATPCTVMLDRTVTEIDSGGSVVVVADLVRITAFRTDIQTQPPRGSRFEIGAEIFTVVSVPLRDESRWVCNCEPFSA